MATYNIFPKSEQDIVDLKMDPGRTGQLIGAYTLVKSKFPNIETPFAISKDNNYKSVKVLRYVSSSMDVKSLKKIAPHFTFTPGDGSRTKKGTASKGAGFEKDLTDYFNLYIREGLDAISDNNIRKFISELEKEYGLDKVKNLIVVNEGGANKRRGVTFIGNQPVIGTDANNFDIGSTVTDITLMDGNKPIVYLSLKYDNFSFFNIGTVNIVPEAQVKQGYVSNPQGLQLFNFLGVDNIKFCKVFNHYRDSSFREPGFLDTNPNYDENRLKKFILSGVGYGYHMVHKKKNGAIEHYKVTKNVAESKSSIKDVKIKYPFVSAKVVYIYVTTDIYKYTIMFRNNQSGIYPNVVQGYAAPV